MPKDLLREAEIARGIAFEPGAEEIGLSSGYILAQVLFALWDSGFYEYVRRNATFRRAAVVEELRYDAMTFDWLAYYLLGRGLLREGPSGELSLTDRGQRFTNTITSGLLNLYVGGYAGLLANLGPLLRREIELLDPKLDRSARHAAAGTEDLTCVRVVPQVVEILREHEVQGILDLGCGTGGFLIQWALAGGRGVGVDMSAAALGSAWANAAHAGVAERLSFHLGEVGREPLPIGEEAVLATQALTAMFLLHEFGRGGDAEIVRVLAALRAQFEGKLLIALEMPPVDVVALNGHPPPSLDALDYHFIHPLSRQGEPRSREAWQSLYQQAGMKLLGVRRPRSSPVLIDLVRM